MGMFITKCTVKHVTSGADWPNLSRAKVRRGMQTAAMTVGKRNGGKSARVG